MAQKVVKERLLYIDFLRGFAILAMILVHTNAYFLHIKLAKWLWDFSEFSVISFIFCSAYIFFSRSFKFSWLEFLRYIKKRVVRLVVPYYIFLIFLFYLIHDKQPVDLTSKYIYQSILMIGGVDINWLILLFLIFSFLFPVLYVLAEKYRKLLYVYISSAVVAAGIFLFIRQLPFDYKYIMWFPWSLVVLACWLTVYYEKKKGFYFFTIIGFGVLYILLYFFQKGLHHSLTQYDNKYPPNLYHLTFGLSVNFLLLWLFKKKWLIVFPFNTLLNFLSRYSYSIYFVHYLVIYWIVRTYDHTKYTWQFFFALVLGLTLVIQYLLMQANKLRDFISRNTLKK